MARKLYEVFVSETTPPDPNLIDAWRRPICRTVRSSIRCRKAVTSAEFQAPTVYFTRYAWPVEFVVRSIKEAGWGEFLGRT